MEDIYTLEEIAKALKVSKMTIYRYIKAGKLSAYKLGKEIRITKSDYELFLNQSKFITTSK